jgi:hypothetical protein
MELSQQERKAKRRAFKRSNKLHNKQKELDRKLMEKLSPSSKRKNIKEDLKSIQHKRVLSSFFFPDSSVTECRISPWQQNLLTLPNYRVLLFSRNCRRKFQLLFHNQHAKNLIPQRSRKSFLRH